MSKKKPKRAEIEKLVQTRVSDAMFTWINTQAAAAGLSMAAWLRNKLIELKGVNRG
jgi:hypothetical protein